MTIRRQSRNENYRELEVGIHTDFKERMSYGEYLQSRARSWVRRYRRSDQHDEMLFIIIHQASELWLKLAGHEVEAAISCVQSRRLPACIQGHRAG